MEEQHGYARFEPLTDDESVDLLRTHEVGRVAWDGPDGPVILPVAYAYSDGLVAFRTAAAGVLARLAEATDVAFQIDDFDIDTATGWSVMMRARSRAVTDTAERERWREALPVPWASGARDLVIRLDPVELTGRVVVRS